MKPALLSFQGKNSRRGTKSVDHSTLGARRKQREEEQWRKFSEPPPDTGAAGFFRRNLLGGGGACSSTSCNTSSAASDHEKEDSPPLIVMSRQVKVLASSLVWISGMFPTHTCANLIAFSHLFPRDKTNVNFF